MEVSMKDRRKLVIFIFIAFWCVWGSLITGTPFKIGAARQYSETQGLGVTPYVGLDIKNVQTFSMKDFVSFMYGNQPSRGPKGTTFDMANSRKDIPKINSIIHNTARFGSPEMVEGFWGPVNPQKVDLPDPAALTKFIKDTVKYFGAVDVAIVELGPRPEIWFFEDDSFGYPIILKPEEHKYAIVALNQEKQSKHPYPKGFTLDTVKNYSKVSKNYFDDDYVAGNIAEMIRMMGYHAWGHNNAYTRNVPLAVKAGLGEYGRFGNLITLEWGGNVRICAITTDLPLVPDKPIDIGVRDVCSMCTRCYDYCPTQAIPQEEMDFMGVHKWTPDFWKCRRSTVVGLDKETDASTCTVCRDVCPYAKDTTYLGNKIGRYLVQRSHIGRKLLLNMDYLLYTKWNKHGLGQLMADRRARLREVNKQYPENNWTKEWFTKGAVDVAGRRIYREKNPLGIVTVAKGGIGIVKPFYTEAAMKDPNFGKWPSWVDPWGRTIPGYDMGKDGAPRLNLRPTVAMIGSTVLSGVAGSPMAPFAMQRMSPEEARKQPVDTWAGAGFDTATNPFGNSYAW